MRALLANRTPSYLLLVLMVFFVEADDVVCPSRCRCRKNKSNKVRVVCRDKGLTQVFSSDKFPSNMHILDLARNEISVLKKGFLDQHSQLEKLYLHKNAIKTLEERAFIGLMNLTRLVLRQNKLGKLKARSFLGLPNLDSLLKYVNRIKTDMDSDLSYNRIRSIDKNAFVGVNKLSKLILSNNSFTSIVNGTFNILTNLKKLSLSNNSIMSIQNGTFDSLTSLRTLEMKNLPLTCDCSLNSFIQYLTSVRLKTVSGSCEGQTTKFIEMRGTNLCETPPELSIIPKSDQVVALGDTFKIVCKTPRKPGIDLGWTKNNKRIITNKDVVIKTEKRNGLVESRILFRSLREKDAGKYVCDGMFGIEPKSIMVNVISPSTRMCPRDVMESDRGSLVWPVSLAGTTAAVTCPWLSNSRNDETAVHRTCTQDGVWGEVKFSNCPYLSLSRKLAVLEKLISRPSFKDVTAVTSKLKLLSNPLDFQNHSEILQIFNVVDGVIQKQMNQPFNKKVFDDILATFNNMMDIDSSILYNAQRSDKSTSRLAARLEYISRRIVNHNISRVYSNIVVGSVNLESGSLTKSCDVVFKADKASALKGVYCGSKKRKDSVVSVDIPPTTGERKQRLKVQFLVYRNANLFPNVITNVTREQMRGRNVSSGVLAIQMENLKEINLTEPLVISFATKAGTNPIVSHFDFAESVVDRPWSPSSDCRVIKATDTMTTVDCARLVNKNLAIMSFLEKESDLAYPMEIVVYFGAIVASVFLLATLLTFAVFRKLRLSRDDVLMLMNACLALLVVVTTFAFGIDRTHNSVVCLIVGILLHFFFLASLLWLGSYIVCVTQRLKPPKESEEEEESFNPVLRYYMVSWGVPAVICGITLAGDVKNYKTSQYCWLTESAGLGAFVGPACLLFIVNCVLLVRLHLLLARRGPDRRASKDNSEEERLHSNEPEVLELAPDPDSQMAAEKSAVTLSLLATWVITSLIYINFIVAYFLIKSRKSKLSWKVLSYVYAVFNISLGFSVVAFHCIARKDVRANWRQAWKRLRAHRLRWRRWRTLWITVRPRGRREQTNVNGKVLVNGEEINLAAPKGDSDRQSNITLPSSAALTNDIFVNGRPLSTARVSLLDDADFPVEENPRAGAELNEVDVTETCNSEDGRRRSQGSVHSERRVVSKIPSENIPLPEENLSVVSNARVSDIHEENHTDITDGVTSKSESSAPTAIEMPLPPTSTPCDNFIPRSFVPAETPVSPSSSSLSEIPVVRGPNFKRKRSCDSLNSRNGSVGPRARKFPQLQQDVYPSSSSTFSEIQPKTPDPKALRSTEPINSRAPALNQGQNAVTQRPRNRYKDGREKPEPKQWMGSVGPRIAYVPVPHVSKIHREPSRNETSV